MKRYNIFIAIWAVLLVIVMACSEVWLKPDPLSFYAPENVYVDEAGFESGLVRCRKEMNADSHGNRHPISTEFGYSDMAIASFQSDFTKNTPSTSAMFPILSLFNDAYSYIKNANVIISRIDNITWTDQAIRNRILSEAYWFRAYWYYRLVNTYGDIPWVGEELKGAKLDFRSTTRKAILEKIQADLEFASEWLPVKAAVLGNVTKGAADHLLTKVYLANCEFDKAIASATAVINGPYALMTQRFGIDAGKKYHDVMWDLHRCENKNIASNTETIYATVDRANAAPDTWWSNPGTYSMRLYSPSYWRVLDATGNRATNWQTPAGDTLGIGNADVRPIWYYNYGWWNEGGYTWQNTPDMRRAPNNWIEMGATEAEIKTVRVGSPQFGLPLVKTWFTNLNDTTVNWYPWPHYKTYTPTPNFNQPHGGQGDWYVFRLAETFLLRAEAYYWKGQLDLAATDINRVRTRAKAPTQVAPAEVTIDYIFNERAKELYTEEPRHSELVRVSFIMAQLNLNGYSLATISQKNWFHDRTMRINHYYQSPPLFSYGVTATIHPNHMLWPVPQTVITANTLGRINQNQGYDGAELNEPPLETIP